MPGSGRSPAQIDADIARLQEGMRRARTVAEAADLRGDDVPLRDEEAYHDAVADVARATRALVDYESRIPQLQEEYRQFLGARLCRRAGGLLAAVSAGLCFAVLPGGIGVWWLALLGPLLLTGLWALPGARRRAADTEFHPRIGAAAFAVAAIVAGICSTGAVTPWVTPVAPLAAWIGLRAFAAPAPTMPPPQELAATVEYSRADR
ncbi:MAG TPA: hypothetical protein VGX23_23415 [Actinocrinis sp.]|nr:hypothetical protein [Actinocrinis sp.]